MHDEKWRSDQRADKPCAWLMLLAISSPCD
jgi:hypothetical protein